MAIPMEFWNSAFGDGGSSIFSLIGQETPDQSLPVAMGWHHPHLLHSLPEQGIVYVSGLSTPLPAAWCEPGLGGRAHQLEPVSDMDERSDRGHRGPRGR